MQKINAVFLQGNASNQGEKIRFRKSWYHYQLFRASHLQGRKLAHVFTRRSTTDSLPLLSDLLATKPFTHRFLVIQLRILPYTNNKYLVLITRRLAKLC